MKRRIDEEGQPRRVVPALLRQLDDAHKLLGNDARLTEFQGWRVEKNAPMTGPADDAPSLLAFANNRCGDLIARLQFIDEALPKAVDQGCPCRPCRL